MWLGYVPCIGLYVDLCQAGKTPNSTDAWHVYNLLNLINAVCCLCNVSPFVWMVVYLSLAEETLAVVAGLELPIDIQNNSNSSTAYVI